MKNFKNLALTTVAFLSAAASATAQYGYNSVSCGAISLSGFKDGPPGPAGQKITFRTWTTLYGVGTASVVIELAVLAPNGTIVWIAVPGCGTLIHNSINEGVSHMRELSANFNPNGATAYVPGFPPGWWFRAKCTANGAVTYSGNIALYQ
jgi:hypothetical protein